MDLTHFRKMMHDLFTNHSAEWKGLAGVFMSVGFPILNEWLDLMHKGFAVVGAVGGIILLVYSIDVMKMKREKLKKELEK